MTILLFIVTFVIPFSLWIAGACDTCIRADDYYDLTSMNFVFVTLLGLAVFFFWPIFRLYFLIRKIS